MPALRFAPATAAVTLALALIAGVACDENAPTETRLPAAAPQGDLSDDPDVVPFDGPTLSAIGLPVNQSVSTAAPAPAFRINQTGSGPNGIFQISNTSNNQPALQGLTNGKGRAGFFRITNTTNTQAALHTQTNGAGLAVSGLATGTGGGGSFHINNTGNSQAALHAETNGRGPAVRGITTNGQGTGGGGWFESNGGPGIQAYTRAGNPAGWFQVLSPADVSPYAIEAHGHSSPLFEPSRAALFVGNVDVQGTLTKTAGSFRIDHPLDPEHKYLSHSFVESPDMMNVYNGNATLDENGRATVELPEYFEALNRDFRYQLTAIGAPGPNLYVAEGVKENRFRIAGGRPYATVSWQVTGVRQDAWANEHRIKVEEDKPQAEPDLVAKR